MKILHLHKMGNPKYWRKAVYDLEYMIPNNAKDVQCVVHPAELKIPEYIKEVAFDAIILGPTFLCSRYDDKTLEHIKKEYNFIKESKAVKIAMPQDDYDCSAILDEWMVEWSIDRVITVCPNHWDVLYTKYSQKGKILLGYTGYISEEMLSKYANPKKYSERTIDISFRGSKLPANFGSIGFLKGNVGELFLKNCADKTMNLDLSSDPSKLILGEKWLDFLEESRACLGTLSGSSLLDPFGEYRKRVNQYTAIYPNAEFQQIADTCFPGEDLKYSFTAISPRNIEAGILKTVQILQPGEYNGLMQPDIHYIPLILEKNAISDICKKVKDSHYMNKIATVCKDTLLSIPELRYKNHVKRIIDMISDLVSDRNIPDNFKDYQRIQKYNSETLNHQKKFWDQNNKYIDMFKNIATMLGARKLMRIVRGIL